MFRKFIFFNILIELPNNAQNAKEEIKIYFFFSILEPS